MNAHDKEGNPINFTLAIPSHIATIEETLPTVIAGEDGALRKTKRKTEVHIYEPQEEHTPMIYEMGIPVVSSGTPFHIDVQQKVPLTMERDNVTPSYRAKLHTLTLNATADRLTTEQVSEGWVSTGLANDKVSTEAVGSVLDTKYGKKRVVHNPNNPEASAVAAANGFTVMYGGNESKDTWNNIRSRQPIKSAGDIFNTNASVEFGGGGDDSLPRNEWFDGMEDLCEFTQTIYGKLFGNHSLVVKYMNDPRGYAACFNRGTPRIIFNYRSLSKRRIANWRLDYEYFLHLLIHEFAHRESDSHFSPDFYNAATKIGAQLALLLAREPELLKGGD